MAKIPWDAALKMRPSELVMWIKAIDRIHAEIADEASRKK